MKTVQTLVLVAFCVLCLTGCEDVYNWNQKLTVVVDTPDGERSGFSVIHIQKRDMASKWAPPEARGVKTRIRGEAVVVPLAPGKVLFALLKGASNHGRPGQMAQYVFDVAKGKFSDRAERLSQLRAARKVPIENYPLLVAFEDLNDPASVKRVSPFDLEDAFGPGYSLKSITLEITEEPVTTGNVETMLDWIMTAEFLIPPSQQPRFAKDQTIEQKLAPSDFIDWSTLYEKRKGKSK